MNDFLVFSVVSSLRPDGFFPSFIVRNCRSENRELYADEHFGRPNVRTDADGPPTHPHRKRRRLQLFELEAPENQKIETSVCFGRAEKANERVN